MLEYFPVPLTTVRVPKFRMAEIATEMLIRHVESKTAIPPQKVYLDAELVVRASTRSLRGGGSDATGVHHSSGGATSADGASQGMSAAGAARRPHQESAPLR